MRGGHLGTAGAGAALTGALADRAVADAGALTAPPLPRESGGRWRGAVLPIMLLVVWEAAGRAGLLSGDSLAPPTAVLAALAAALADGTLLARTAETLGAMLTGLALGTGAGFTAGIALGLAPGAVRRSLQAPVELLRPIPSVALIPLALMGFGFGLAMESSIVAFATFWPALILAESAVAGVDRNLLEVARALQLGPVARVFKIVLPAATPRLVVALRLAIGVALVVAVTVEIAANPQGLGYELVIAQQSLRPALMLAALIWVGLLGWGANAVLLGAERWLLRRRGVGVATSGGSAG